jgi:hypothetical protein
MKVMGLLGPPWFSLETPKGFIDRYNRDLWFRKRMLARSKAGIRLTELLGYRLFMDIAWVHATPAVAGGDTSDDAPPDLHWILEALIDHNPDLIVGYGPVAEAALKEIEFGVPVLIGCHPCAREYRGEHPERFAKKVLFHVTQLQKGVRLV